MAVSMTDMMNSSVKEIQRYQSELSVMQEKMTKGVKILSAEDDPAAYARIQTLEKKVEELEGYETTGAIAKMRLNIGEQAMSGALDALQRARELALQASSDTQTSESRSAIAVEVRGIIDRIISMSNTQDGSGNYMFGGDNVDDLPFEVTRDPVTNKVLRVDYVGSDSAHRMAKIGMDEGAAGAVGSTRIPMAVSGRDMSASEANAYGGFHAYLPIDPTSTMTAKEISWDATYGMYVYSKDEAGTALPSLSTYPELALFPQPISPDLFSKDTDGDWINTQYKDELSFIEDNDLIPVRYAGFAEFSDPVEYPAGSGTLVPAESLASGYNSHLAKSFDVSNPFSPNYDRSADYFDSKIYDGFVESETFNVSNPLSASYDNTSVYYDSSVETGIINYQTNMVSNPLSTDYDTTSTYYDAALEAKYDVSDYRSANYDPSSADYDATLDRTSSSYVQMDSDYNPSRIFDFEKGQLVPFENANDVPTSIFESLIRMAERLENNQDVSPSIANIDNNIETLSANRAQIGTYLSTIDTQLDINDSFKLEFKETLSNLKDLDMAEAIMEFQSKMMALQLAQQAFQQIKEMSMASKNIF